MNTNTIILSKTEYETYQELLIKSDYKNLIQEDNNDSDGCCAGDYTFETIIKTETFDKDYKYIIKPKKIKINRNCTSNNTQLFQSFKYLMELIETKEKINTDQNKITKS